MALVRGIHLLADGSKSRAREIAPDINQYQRLLVGVTTTFGAGVYAWYPSCLPDHLKSWPQVYFEIDDTIIEEVILRDGRSLGFFRMPGNIGNYVTISVIEFRNVW